MPFAVTLSSFVVKVGNELWDLGGDFQFDFTVTANTAGEVLQNLYNTFATRYGTQRLQRTFGLDMSWIDMPGNIATMQGQIAVLQACSYWEPRAAFRLISFVLDTTEVLAGVYRLYCELDVNLDLSISTAIFAPPAARSAWVIDSPYDGTPDAAFVAKESLV